MTYFDNAATSFPKPPQVYKAVNEFMTTIGASPNRASHRNSIAANNIIFDTRELLATLLNAPGSDRIIFTQNATQALNQIFFGVLQCKDRVIVSSMEHNAVMRPLRYLEKVRGIRLDIVPCSKAGEFDLASWKIALNKGAAMAVVTHGSNVIGSLAPLGALGALCRKTGTRFIVDAAQTAGLREIDVQGMHIDALAFSGHKGLLGPQGTGGFYLVKGLQCTPLIFGGTGSNSESEEQPAFLPDFLESGTINGPGLAGLYAGVQFILETGIATIASHESFLLAMLLEGLRTIARVQLYSPAMPLQAIPNVSITLDGMDAASVAQILDEKYDIATRVGLHCAPMAHRTIGTFPKGTLRISIGYFNSTSDIKKIVEAIRTIAS